MQSETQPCLGFELGLPAAFPMRIIIALSSFVCILFALRIIT